MNEQPVLRVVGGGEPTAEEVAALVIALTRRAAAGRADTNRSAWANRSAALRRPLPHGADAWRLSARPGAF